MDTQDTNKPYQPDPLPGAHSRGRFNGAIIGIFLVIMGGLSIARKTGADIPDYIFSWQMLLIGIGVVIGLQTRFRSIGWLVPILVGTVFLLDDIFPNIVPRDFIFPAVLIVIGLLFIFRRSSDSFMCSGRSRRGNSGNSYDAAGTAAGTNAGNAAGAAAGAPTGNDAAGATNISDRLDESAIFGNIRKNVISKHFTGGEVSSVFAGAEINLLQADPAPGAKLELNAVFGGIKLIVPAHWQIKLQSNAVLGGVEDKRPRHAIYSEKILTVEANAVFGGIEIESH